MPGTSVAAETLPSADGVQLQLHVTDADVCAALEKFETETERQTYALKALAIGVAACNEATGRIDVDAIRDVGTALVRDLEQAFDVQRETVGEGVAEVAAASNRTLLAQFSLDDPESALSRFLRECGSQQGVLTANLRESVAKVGRELSLDEPDSALSRLRAELLKRNQEFHDKVLAQVTHDEGRRQERKQSTGHGTDFENEVFTQVQRLSQEAGDVASHVGYSVGELPRSKVGDVVVDIGTDSQAAGHRVVLEAKAERDVSLKAALAELDTAKKNRHASVGIFVYRAEVAPVELAPWKRYGRDIVVAWNPDEPVTDVYMECALSVAKAIMVQEQRSQEPSGFDDALVRRTLGEMEQTVEQLEDVATWTATIETATAKIKARIDRIRQALGRQVERLNAETGTRG